MTNSPSAAVVADGRAVIVASGTAVEGPVVVVAAGEAAVAVGKDGYEASSKPVAASKVEPELRASK